MISQIADNVAQAGCRDKGKVKAELLETIAMSIARSVAKAVMRRQPKSPQAHSNSASSTFLFESAIFGEPIEDDLVALSSSPALLPRVLIFPGVYTLSVPQQKVHKHWGIVTPRLPCCSTCGPWRPPWPPSLGLLRLLRPRPSLAAFPPSQPCLSRPRPWHALRGRCGCGPSYVGATCSRPCTSRGRSLIRDTRQTFEDEDPGASCHVDSRHPKVCMCMHACSMSMYIIYIHILRTMHHAPCILHHATCIMHLASCDVSFTTN